MHTLLLQQLQCHCANSAIQQQYDSLFQAISATYEQYDHSMGMLENSLQASLAELNERNQLLREQLLTLGDTQAKLQQSLTALHAIFDATGEIIFSLDTRGHLLKSNKMGRELLPDVARYEGVTKPISWDAIARMLLNSSHLAEITAWLEEDPARHITGTLAFTNGRIFEYHSLPQLQQDALIGRVWCMRDVTEEKKTEELIHHQAFHDALTGLPNRNLLLERIARAIDADKQHKKIAIIFIDLDNFKKINDTEGHEAGDQLLCDASERMRSCIRDVDILARLGGDEFVIMIEAAISQSALTRLCANILDVLAQPFILNNHSHFIGCSMGVSIYPRDDVLPEGLIGKADMAMYRAKELGKNNFQFYSEELERLALHQLDFERNLRFAIANDEIHIYLQPEVSLVTGKVVAAEALVRWIRPDGSMILPAQFIPVAEQSNLIAEIGRIVLARVCHEIVSWKEFGVDNITVAVNLSAREFQDKELVKNFRRRLASHNIPGERIVLEITESLFMEDKDSVLSIMNSLRDMGVKFAIDDFGTGYSSFGYLQDLPIDYLKIDRSFLTDVTQNKKQYAIVRSIIDIGNHLGLTVIAEGIENQETLDFTVKNHCAMAQGYFLYRPMPTEDFAELLKSQYCSNEKK